MDGKLWVSGFIEYIFFFILVDLCGYRILLTRCTRLVSFSWNSVLTLFSAVSHNYVNLGEGFLCPTLLYRKPYMIDPIYFSVLYALIINSKTYWIYLDVRACNVHVLPIIVIRIFFYPKFWCLNFF